MPKQPIEIRDARVAYMAANPEKESEENRVKENGMKEVIRRAEESYNNLQAQIHLLNEESDRLTNLGSRSADEDTRLKQIPEQKKIRSKESNASKNEAISLYAALKDHQEERKQIKALAKPLIPIKKQEAKIAKMQSEMKTDDTKAQEALNKENEILKDMKIQAEVDLNDPTVKKINIKNELQDLQTQMADLKQQEKKLTQNISSYKSQLTAIKGELSGEVLGAARPEAKAGTHVEISGGRRQQLITRGHKVIDAQTLDEVELETIRKAIPEIEKEIQLKEEDLKKAKDVELATIMDNRLKTAQTSLTPKQRTPEPTQGKPSTKPTWTQKQVEVQKKLEFYTTQLESFEQRKTAAMQTINAQNNAGNVVSQDAINECHDIVRSIDEVKEKIDYLEADKTRIEEAIKNKNDQPYTPSTKRDPSELSYIDSNGITWDKAYIRGIPVRIGRVDGEIVDVQAKLTDKQYQNMVTNFDKTDRSHGTSSPVYIFQSELAAYERLCLDHTKYQTQVPGMSELAKNLRTWSSFYAKLEAMVNNTHGFTDPLKELISRLEELIKEINDPNNNMPSEMKAALLLGTKSVIGRDNVGINTLLAQAKELRDHPQADQEQAIRRLFSVQPEGQGSSIGQLLNHQMSIFSAQAVKEATKLTDDRWGPVTNYSRQLFLMHPFIKHMLDAGSYLERKRSLNGIAMNNSRDPIDAGMVATEVTEKNPRDDNPEYTSVMGYMGVTQGDKDLMFKHLDPVTSGIKEPSNRPGFFAQTGVFLTGVFEMGWAAVYRVATEAPMGIAYGAAKLFGMVWHPTSEGRKEYNAWIDEKFANGEKRISKGHKWLSSWMGIIGAKNLRNKIYPNELNQLEDPASGFDGIANSLTGSRIGSGLSSLVGFFLTPAQYVADSNTKEAKEARTAKKRKKENKTQYNEMLFQAFKRGAADQFNDSRAQPVPPGQQSRFEDEHCRAGVQPWDKNEFTTSLEFFDDIFVSLADILISPMFRKAPGLATICFIMAHISFGMMMAPSVLAGTAAAGVQQGVMGVSAKIAMSFMGKTVSGAHATMLAKALTAFLEFKLPLFTAEGIIECSIGDGEFIKAAMEHPENATLGLAVLLGATMFISHVPNVPMLHIPEGLPQSWDKIPGINVNNPISSITNTLLKEAYEVQKGGLYPVTGLEFGFLTFKLSVLAHTMISSKIDPAEKEEVFLAYTLLTPTLDAEGKTKVFKEGEEKTGQEKLLADMRALLKADNVARGKGNELSLKNLPEPERKNLIRKALGQNGINPGRLMEQMVEQIHGDLLLACGENDANNIQVQNSKASLEALKIAKEQAKTNPTQKAAPSKRQVLMELMQEIQMWGDKPMSLEMANVVYDKLYYAFKEYNNEQRELGHLDKMFPKEDVLAGFNTKFIQPHQVVGGGRGLVNSIVAWAAALVPFAKISGRIKHPHDSPHQRNRVKMNAAGDRVGLRRLPAILFMRPGQAYGTGVSKSSTAGVGAAASVALTGYAFVLGVGGVLGTPFAAVFGKKGAVSRMWNGLGDHLHRRAVALTKSADSFNVENLTAPDSIKNAQAKDAHLMGISSKHFAPSTEHALKTLREHEEEEKLNPGQTGWTSGYVRVHADKKSDKSLRKEEKELLGRYAKSMSSLEKRVNELKQRLEAVYPEKNYSQYHNEINTLRDKMKEYRDNPAVSEATINTRLGSYNDQIEKLGTIEQVVQDGENKQKTDSRNEYLESRIKAFTINLEDFNRHFQDEDMKKLNIEFKGLNSLKPEEIINDNVYSERVKWIEEKNAIVTQRKIQSMQKEGEAVGGLGKHSIISTVPPATASHSDHHNGHGNAPLPAGGTLVTNENSDKTMFGAKDHATHDFQLRMEAAHLKHYPAEKKAYDQEKNAVLIVPDSHGRALYLQKGENPPFPPFKDVNDLLAQLNSKKITMELDGKSIEIVGKLSADGEGVDFCKRKDGKADGELVQISKDEMERYSVVNGTENFNVAVMEKLTSKVAPKIKPIISSKEIDEPVQTLHIIHPTFHNK